MKVTPVVSNLIKCFRGTQINFPFQKVSPEIVSLSHLVPIHSSAFPYLTPPLANNFRDQILEKIINKQLEINLERLQPIISSLSSELSIEIKSLKEAKGVPEVPIIVGLGTALPKDGLITLLIKGYESELSIVFPNVKAKFLSLQGRFPVESKEIAKEGIPASHGIAIGKALLLEPEEPLIEKRAIPASELEKEIARLLEAVNSVIKDYEQLISNLRSSTPPEQLKTIEDQVIIRFEGVILAIKNMEGKHSELVAEIIKQIKEEKVNAEWAVKQVIDRQIHRFEKNEVTKNFAIDLHDVHKQIIGNLLGKKREMINLNEPVIIVVHALTPAEAAQLDKKWVIGIVTDVGGFNDHAAIVARALGIPGVVGTGNITEIVETGDMLIVQGTEGKVIVHPTFGTLESYEQHRLEDKDFMEGLIREIKEKPWQTKDGVEINLEVNIQFLKDLETEMYGVRNIGLFRTEFGYLDHLPTEEELYKVYKRVSAQFPGTVIIRTLDIGGDKPLPHLGMPQERNPWMGCRGIRFSMKRPDIFKTQIRAILRASAEKRNIQILIPMISKKSEVEWALEKIEEVKKELSETHIPFDEDIQVGIMVEIPAAVTMSRHLAKLVKFFSIGSNDLTQYTVATDRENEGVAYLYDEFHSVMLQAFANVAKQAKNNKIKISLCGEMASEPEALPLLLGLGITPSVGLHALPKIKFLLQTLGLAECQALVKKLMTAIKAGKLFSGEEIKEFVRKNIPFPALERMELLRRI